MNFATWSLRNPIPVILLFTLLALAGVWGFMQLPIQDLPDLELPSINVTLVQPGAAPAQLETEVARKVENSLATLGGVRHMQTTIGDGVVHIHVQFVLEKTLSDALIETKDAVDRVRSDLPADLLQPAVNAVSIGGSPILTYAVASDHMDPQALSWFVDDRVSRALFAVPGVGRVERLGGVQREVRVEVDLTRMQSLAVTPADISHALLQVQQESSGGQARLGQAEQSVRTIATVRQADELMALPLSLADGRQLRLDHVAAVSDTHAVPSQRALLDGRTVIGFNVYRARGFDETRIAAGVAEVIATLERDTASLRVTPISSSVEYTHEQYRGSMQMLLEGAALAILVVWWFLRDWRATLVAASALPLSILPAFAAMLWLGYSLNTLTLLALAVIVGILVDDAIVEIENIERHRRLGKSVQVATRDAVDEIALAVVATTLTLVVVFVPTTMMSGIPGLFFQQFGWTAVIAVLSSLLVARLLTPVMAAWLLRPGDHEEKPDSPTMTRYLHAVRWCLAHRRATVMAATAFFLASLALVPLIPTGLIPASDHGHTSVNFELPPGSSLDDSTAMAEKVRVALGGIEGVATVFAVVGSAQSSDDGQGAPEVRRGTLTLTLAPRGERPTQQQVEEHVRAALDGVPGARFALGSGGPGEQLSLILASDDGQALKATSQALVQQLRGVNGLFNISSTASLERPELMIRPNRERAAEQGVTAVVIGDTVRIATSGDFDAQLSKLNLDSRQIAIRVRMSEADQENLETLSNLRVRARDGLVPLASVADLTLESGPSQIHRYDRQRFVTVSADLAGMPLGDAMAAALALPAAQSMPDGVSLIEAGDAEMAAELASGFGLAIVTGILCMFCVLILLFKDFLQPVTILSAIPLSLGGAFVALLVAGSELDVPSMIGLVMLMGIVTKNSILLVEYAVVGIQERGLTMVDALIDACHKRARPIVMTTVAMIAGMLPIALGFGADASFRQPMAIAVIGGLITSTLLSLLVVPVVFTYVDGLESRIRGLFVATPLSSTGAIAHAPS